MGLDVYLRRYENFEDAIRREDEYEKRSSKEWEEAGGYNALDESQRKEVKERTDKIKEELGLNSYGSVGAPDVIEIENNSSKHPNHLFKVGYFRSSYNGSGFNRMLPDLCGHEGLYKIFNNEKEEYYVRPDWDEARKETVIAIEMLKKAMKNKIFRAHSLRNSAFINSARTNNFADVPKNEEEAKNVFMKKFEEWTKDKNDFCGGCFESKEGLFSIKKPLEIYGIINGVSNNILSLLRGETSFEPGLFIIMEESDNAKWCLAALEIVLETIDYVLDQCDSNKYYLHWSA